MSDGRDELTSALRELHEWASGELNSTRKLVAESQRKLADEVGERIRKMNTRLDEAGREWKKLLGEQSGSVDKKFAALSKEVTSVAKNAESAQRQCVVLNRQIRMIQAPGMTAEIDDWAAGQAELGVLAADGREAAHQLRGMTDTREPTARIKQYRDEDAAYQRHLHEAVTAARQLTTVDPTTSRRVLAELVERWAGNRKEATRLAQLLPHVKADARRAQDDLDTASRKRADLRHRAERGEQAERTLYQNIDTFLYPVLDGGKVLPLWFDLALGCGIAGRDWPDWLDTAIRLIRYRIVYQVPPGCDALGPRPTAEGQQSAEYDRLRADCAAYRL
ncbi:hypothetical protein ACWEVP_20095 [Amycolatopsis sp. NPDC003865]